ncbi:MAG: 4a-hydroxytetrahydrobiopterin dehydratase [Verrucomicrobiota bacterium]
MSELIEETDLDSWMKKVPEWEYNDGGISRMFEFDEYMMGIDFVNDVAEIAEEAGHHPDMTVFWCRVRCELTTHDLGGVTEEDFELAGRIDTLVD